MTSPLRVDSSTFDKGHGQYVAERLIHRLAGGLAEIEDDAVVIGVLNDDMRIDQIPEWRYGFSLRGESRAVVSSFRMVDGGRRPRVQRFRHRLHVMIGKDVAILRCGYPLSDDPRAVTYGAVLGPTNLDAMELDIVSGRPSP